MNDEIVLHPNPKLDTGKLPPMGSYKKKIVTQLITQKQQYDDLLRKSALEKLYVFNKFVLDVEQGKDELAPVHKKVCNFVQDNVHRKKLILMPRGHLKALHTESTMVLTPDGFVPYKNLAVGDEVVGGDGKTTKVIKIHPKQRMELYRVTTDDGRTIVCNTEHLFRVRIRANDTKWRIRNLSWILDRYKKERTDNRDGSDYCENPVQIEPITAQFSKRKLPIDPYTLGMWLGDGHSAGARMTTADPEIFDYSAFSWHKLSSKYGYGTYGLQKILREQGLKNNKHIPHEYLVSSVEQRLELLRGLMDTDGTCHKDGGIAYFSNTNYQLITDVVALIRSLGGVARICKVNQTVNEEPYDTWIISVKLPHKYNPFNLSRKRNLFTGLKRELAIKIVSIEKVHDDTANCITVENPDGMFIANDYFPTHNSTLITIGYSVQQIVKNPNVRILVLSATWQMAVDFLTEIKNNLTKNERLIELYGNLAADPVEWSQDRITLKRTDMNIKGPTVWAAGIDSNLVGSHPDIIIFDDVVNRDNTQTREQIDKVILRYKDSLDLLEPKGQLIVIGTRWVEGDLYDWIMDREHDIYQSYDILVERAFEGNIETGDNFQAIWPEKFSLKELRDRLREKGWYEFSAQYQNDPVPDQDADFKREWFQYYDREEYRGKDMMTVITIDPAIALKKDSDYTAMVVTGIDQFTNIFIKDIARGHWRPNEIIDTIFNLAELYQPRVILLETVAYQQALAYALKDEMQKRRKFLPLQEVRFHDMNKDQRIRGLQPIYMNKKVFHPKNVRLVPYLEEELLKFPRAKHDDMIDALSMTLDYLVPPRQKKKDRYQRAYLY